MRLGATVVIPRKNRRTWPSDVIETAESSAMRGFFTDVVVIIAVDNLIRYDGVATTVYRGRECRRIVQSQVNGLAAWMCKRADRWCAVGL
jgi:hypothetical protein